MSAETPSVILIVEDDRQVAEAIASRLRRDGFAPLVAPSAAAAYDAVVRSRPDLVLGRDEAHACGLLAVGELVIDRIAGTA
jgi:DNA-binding NtrC family response regulator